MPYMSWLFTAYVASILIMVLRTRISKDTDTWNVILDYSEDPYIHAPIGSL